MRAAQEDGGGTGMIRPGIGANAAGRRMRQVAHHTHVVAQFFKRLQALGEFEPGTFLRGGPFVHGGAVRHVDTAESALGRGGGLASGVCAGTIESSRGSASVTPIPRKNVRRGKCFLVMNIILLFDPLFDCDAPVAASFIRI